MGNGSQYTTTSRSPSVHWRVACCNKDTSLRSSILSGTFIPDNWQEIEGIIDLFPNPEHPFKGSQFKKGITEQDVKLGSDLTKTTRSKLDLLASFLMGFTFS
jgi:hypothetical protein